MAEPTAEQLAEARRLGADYYAKHLGKGYSCPFAFCNFPGISQAEFDRDKRPLLNAFHDGWAAAVRSTQGATSGGNDA